jgi:translation initiation factor 2 alpha subunit (eIF-2alpha)
MASNNMEEYRNWYSFGKQFHAIETKWKTPEIQAKLSPEQKKLLEDILKEASSNVKSLRLSIYAFATVIAFAESMIEAVEKSKLETMDESFSDFIRTHQEMYRLYQMGHRTNMSIITFKVILKF